MNMLNKKYFSVITIVLVFCSFLLCSDTFTKGYVCDVVAYDDIDEEDFLGYSDLDSEVYEIEFMPVYENFLGFEINLTNISEGNSGELVFSIYDNNTLVDEISVNINNLSDKEFYKVYCNESLLKNKVYKLSIAARDTKDAPYIQLVDNDYLSEENLSGNALIGYSYKEPVFTIQDKALFCVFAIALWLFILRKYVSRHSNRISVVAMFVFLTGILTWNYTFNTMGDNNGKFENFSHGSETLVTSVIKAEINGIGISEYGLGRYYDVLGKFSDYDGEFITTDNWTDGYSNDEAAIVVASNQYTKSVAIIGNYVRFSNGECLQIRKINDNEETIKIYFSSDKVLDKSKYGDLSEAVFLDSDKEVLPIGRLEKYVSQYGLQGKIFRHVARYIEQENVVQCLNLICSFVTAMVFVYIVMLLAKKYNVLMAGCFFVTFWLSPWIVNFASNLYWVEFTWFIPMAIGLFCSINKDDKRCRLVCYISTFIAILIKCLCGYEYISVIMMGLIAFLLIDFICAIFDRDKAQAKLLFKIIFTLGIMALLGFLVAILIHAGLRGDGNLIQGVKNIFEQDVLRRTAGADMNNFGEELWPSFNASVWEVLCKYFHFSTEIISGIDGALFPLLCVIPLVIFIFEYNKGVVDKEKLIMYIVFFVSCISWFVLAKSHSYIHKHLNYVLWYFGFIQICFLIICDKIRKVFLKK